MKTIAEGVVSSTYNKAIETTTKVVYHGDEMSFEGDLFVVVPLRWNGEKYTEMSLSYKSKTLYDRYTNEPQVRTYCEICRRVFVSLEKAKEYEREIYKSYQGRRAIAEEKTGVDLSNIRVDILEVSVKSNRDVILRD